MKYTKKLFINLNGKPKLTNVKNPTVEWAFSVTLVCPSFRLVVTKLLPSITFKPLLVADRNLACSFIMNLNFTNVCDELR